MEIEHAMAPLPAWRVLVVCAAAAFLLPLSMTQASTLESASGGFVSYQFDGATHHDAPDACLAAGAAWSIPFGNRTDGMLVAPDDLADAFILDVPAGLTGSRIAVRVNEVAGPELDFTILAPDCSGDVFAPANTPVPPPQPPAPAANERQVTPASLEPYVCDSDVWMFAVGGWHHSAAPASLFAAWTDGSDEVVNRTWHEGEWALYTTTSSLAFTLTGAWINVPADWTGRFLVARGPCDAADGGAIYGEAPLLRGDLLEFTPVQSGRHVVEIRLAQPQPQVPGSLVVPVSCHACVGGAEDAYEKVAYHVGADDADQA